MKIFKDRITLVRNSRGCYILDTVKGCRGVSIDRPGGCYGECYARKIATRYAVDFSHTVRRTFSSESEATRLLDFGDSFHTREIVRAISQIEMPFVRIGEMGDPSEDWEHTIAVCRLIAEAGKPIVIITKHWEILPTKLLSEIERLPIYLHTSISALDTSEEIEHRLYQFYRLKSVCTSILRIVSCDFNLDTLEGFRYALVQKNLFTNTPFIDTVFRPSPENPLVVNGVIHAERVPFLRSIVLASVYTKSAYLGDCPGCPDQCGVPAPRRIQAAERIVSTGVLTGLLAEETE